MNRRGFTLVELLVVIAIIGLLATFAVAQLSGARDKARVAKGQAFSSQILRSVGDDLVGRWDFDECNGSTVADTSGYGFNGTFVSGGWNSTDTPALSGGCSGIFSNTYVQMLNYPLAPSTSFTISAWMKFNAMTGSYQMVVSDGSANYRLGIDPSSHPFIDPGSRADSSYAGFTFTTGKWYQYVLVGRQSGGVGYADAYVDGNLIKTWNLGAYAYYGTTEAMFIGGQGGSYPVNGLINDVRIYNRALSAKDIHEMYAEGQAKHLAQSR